MSGTQFQALVLARNNLNLAYQRVVRNKGAAGVDGALGPVKLTNEII
jgi:RNA-directed DNA polymerase